MGGPKVGPQIPPSPTIPSTIQNRYFILSDKVAIFVSLFYTNPKARTIWVVAKVIAMAIAVGITAERVAHLMLLVSL